MKPDWWPKRKLIRASSCFWSSYFCCHGERVNISRNEQSATTATFIVFISFSLFLPCPQGPPGAPGPSVRASCHRSRQAAGVWFYSTGLDRENKFHLARCSRSVMSSSSGSWRETKLQLPSFAFPWVKRIKIEAVSVMARPGRVSARTWFLSFL